MTYENHSRVPFPSAERQIVEALLAEGFLVPQTTKNGDSAWVLASA